MGGTRFVGKRLVKLFLDKGYLLTIASRRKIGDVQGLTQVTGERNQTLNILRGLEYDLAVDFTAYNYNEVSNFFCNIKCRNYVLISSSWVSQFYFRDRIFDINQQQYVQGKIDVENFLKSSPDTSTKITIVRFPIILGLGDASGRMDYLASRLYQKLPIILPNGGTNKTKICYAGDAALFLSAISELSTLNNFEVFDCLPNESISIFNLVNIMGDSLKVAPKIIQISLDEILLTSPEFLNSDPFYQEKEYTTQSLNTFEMFGIQPKLYREWIGECLQTYTPNSGNLKSPFRVYKWDQIKFKESEKVLINAYTQ